MHAPNSQPPLRLVGASDDPPALAPQHAAGASTVQQAVALENRAAMGNHALQPTDPRWVLAARAYGQLQGSTLSPERRERNCGTLKPEFPAV